MQAVVAQAKAALEDPRLTGEAGMRDEAAAADGGGGGGGATGASEQATPTSHGFDMGQVPLLHSTVSTVGLGLGHVDAVLALIRGVHPGGCSERAVSHPMAVTRVECVLCTDSACAGENAFRFIARAS